jgi:phosphohistidine phosphatase
MKTLLLMRHAKSSWKETDLPDQERPLNKRGRNDAPLMGHLLVDRELVPERILSSSAVRARQTAEAVIETSGFKGPVDTLDQLYLAEAEDYIAALQKLPDALERVMIIGHNPGLETLLQMLSKRIESLPTAVLAHLVLPIDQWSQLTVETTGELVEIWRPKELREEMEEEEEKKAKPKSKDKGKSKEKSKKKGK